MSSLKRIICQHCGRDNFKTQRGLHCHQAKSTICNAARRAARARLDQQQDDANVQSEDADSDQNAYDNRQQYEALFANAATMDDIVMQADDSSTDSDEHQMDGDGNQKETTMSEEASKPLEQFKAYAKEMAHHSIPFNASEVAAIKLMDILKRKGSTLDTYNEIMQWHVDQGARHGYISRDKMMEKLAARYNVPHTIINKRTKSNKKTSNKKVFEFAKQRPLILPSSGAKVNIIYNDARDNVVSLLTDPRFGDDDFLHFDDDPLAPPPATIKILGDINTGTAYRETYKKLITNPKKEMLCPMLLYIDGAVTGQFDKLQVEALKMSLGILKKRARDRDAAWRTLGWVPNYTPSDSRGKQILQESGHVAQTLFPTEADEGAGASSDSEDASVHSHGWQTEQYDNKHANKSQDYHAILSALLDSYAQLEKDGLLWDYKCKGKIYKVVMKFFIMFVKCDGDEADKLCAKQRSRGRHIKQICRYCTIPTDKLDSHYMPRGTKLKSFVTIRNLVDRHNVQKLKDMSQHYVVNAFHARLFGQHSKQGIHGSCPMEMLHHILLGIFKHCRDCFLEQIGPKSQAAPDINALGKLVGRLIAHQSERDVPKTNFSKGIFEKGKIMGKEFTGVLLIIAVILQVKRGRDLLKGTRKRNFKDSWQREDWSLLVETLLEWEAFLKLDTMKREHVTKLRRKHHYIMYLMKKIARRSEGMGLKVMKFHGILHLVQDILAFGVPSVVDTGPNESHHKVTKVAAKLTQRNIRVFEWQTARRLVEFFLVDMAMAELEGLKMWEYLDPTQNRGLHLAGDGVSQDNLVSTGGTRIQVFEDNTANQEDNAQWCFASSVSTSAYWDATVTTFLNQLQNHLQDHVQGFGDLDVRTEHKRGNLIFRGHPSFRRDGQWNDWALFNWGSRHGKLAGEIWCFVDLSEQIKAFRTEFAGCDVQSGSVYAVVESAEVDANLTRDHGALINDSNLCVPWNKMGVQLDNDNDVTGRTFYLADVESIVSPMCLIPDIGSVQKTRYLEVRPRRKWHEYFIAWLSKPHDDDEREMSSIEGTSDDESDSDDDDNDTDISST